MLKSKESTVGTVNTQYQYNFEQTSSLPTFLNRILLPFSSLFAPFPLPSFLIFPPFLLPLHSLTLSPHCKKVGRNALLYSLTFSLSLLFTHSHLFSHMSQPVPFSHSLPSPTFHPLSPLLPHVPTRPILSLAPAPSLNSPKTNLTHPFPNPSHILSPSFLSPYPQLTFLSYSHTLSTTSLTLFPPFFHPLSHPIRT
jgi:hypothetical protein